jgi:hypothetical protein
LFEPVDAALDRISPLEASRSYSIGTLRFDRGGITGSMPRSAKSLRMLSPVIALVASFISASAHGIAPVEGKDAAEERLLQPNSAMNSRRFV